MNKKIQILIGTLVLILIIGTVLSIANEKKADEKKIAENPAEGKVKEYFTIKASDSTGTFANALYVAEELGYFEEEGIKIDWKGVVASGQQLGAVLSGTLDVGSGHINRHIAAVAAGAKIKVVAATSETTKEQPHMVYLVLENSSIRSVEDLLGKKISLTSFGGCNEYTPYEYLKKNGIQDPKEKIELTIIPSGKEEQVLRQGEIDVGGFHGWPDATIKRGGVRILFSDYDVWGTEGGNAPYYFSTDFINKNPDAVRGFVKAIAKANDFINADYDEAKRITAKRTGLKTEEMTHRYFTEHAVIKENTVQIWLDLLERYGEIKPGLKTSDIYTNEFNPYYKT